MRYEELATRLGDAILALAENSDALCNFESYLSYNFAQWLRKDASSVEGLVEEFEGFARMWQQMEVAE